MEYSADVRGSLMSVELGETFEGKLVQLDSDRFVSTRMLLHAKSVGGKCWALRRLPAQTHN